MRESVSLKQDIRESILFLMLKLLILESLIATSFFFFTVILDFFELNGQDTLTNVFSVEGFLMFLLVILQIGLTIVVILKWIYNYYEISMHMVVRYTGFIFKHQQVLYLKDVNEVTLHQGVLGRLFNYGTLELLTHIATGVFYIRRVSYPKKNLNLIKDILAEVKGA